MGLIFFNMWEENAWGKSRVMTTNGSMINCTRAINKIFSSALLDKTKLDTYMEGTHQGIGSGHFVIDITTCKIMHISCRWPTLHKGYVLFVRGCDECYQSSTSGKQDFMPLYPIAISKPFKKWGLDFINPFSLTTKGKLSQYKSWPFIISPNK